MSRISIGVDTWSYHRALDPLPGEGPARTLEDLLPLLTEAGVEAVSLSSGLETYRTGEPLRRLRRLIEDCHFEALVSAGAIAPPGEPLDAVAESVLPVLDVAAFLGARVCRVITGWFREAAFDPARAIERTVAALRYFEPRARERGVRLALENHSDFRLAELRAVFDAVSSEWVGLTFDPQNCAKVCDDPLAVCASLLPRIFATHLRDHRSESVFEPGRTARYGVKLINCPLGRGIVPVREALRALADGRPDAPWIVESIPGVGDEHDAVVADVRWLQRARSELAGAG